MRTVDEMAREYTKADGLAVLLAWDSETDTGLPPIRNDFVAWVVRAPLECFIGFDGVDPLRGKAAVAELERAVTEPGLHGLQFHPGRRRSTCMSSGTCRSGTGPKSSGSPSWSTGAPPTWAPSRRPSPAHEYLRSWRVALAGRSGSHGAPQADCVHLPVGMVTQALQPGVRPRHWGTAAGQDALRDCYPFIRLRRLANFATLDLRAPFKTLGRGGVLGA